MIDSEERLRHAQRAAHAGTWDWDIAAGTIYWSEEYYLLYGIEPQSCPASYENWLACVHPDDRSYADRQVRDAFEEKCTFVNFDFRIRHPVGERWLKCRGQIFYDGEGMPVRMVGLSIDVTERKHQEEEFARLLDREQANLVELRAREQQFRFLAETIPQMVWMTTADGGLEFFNQRWYDYTGQGLEQTRGWRWSDLLHPDDRERCLEIWNYSLTTGALYEIEYRLRAADGTYRWHLGRALPLRNDAGQIIRWFGTCTDIDDRIRADAERERLLASEQEARAAAEAAQKEAEVARREAEAANHAKDDFLAMLSHELRTPLNSIIGWAQLLRRGIDDLPKQQMALEVIERNARLQNQLIEDLLDVSRIIRGKLSIEMRLADLRAVVLSASEAVRHLATQRQIRLESHLEEGRPLLVDSMRIQQVVWNLLTNAVKFTPEGGRVEVRLQQTERAVRIIVSDDGIGIDTAFLPYVFERFRQEENPQSRGGLGLGLFIVRHLVELHGGTVSVHSDGNDRGSTFTVELPRPPRD